MNFSEYKFSWPRKKRDVKGLQQGFSDEGSRKLYAYCGMQSKTNFTLVMSEIVFTVNFCRSTILAQFFVKSLCSFDL